MPRLSSLLAAIVCVFFIGSVSVAAKDLQTALQFWLDNEDEKAIPLLAELAAGGNEDAALILGHHEARKVAYSPYLATLTPNERNALLRAPIGLSGTSWLRVLADTNETAAHLQLLEGEQSFISLLEAGEIAPATHLLWNRGKNIGWEFASERYFAGDLPKSMRHQAWLAVAYGREEIGEAKSAILWQDFVSALRQHHLQAFLALRFFYHQMDQRTKVRFENLYEISDTLRIFTYQPEYWKDTDKKSVAAFAHDILKNAPELAKLRSICADFCPSNIRLCTRSLYYGVDGLGGLSRLQTPLERLIPSETYFSSKRHRADILRASYPRFSGMFQSKFTFAKHKFEVETFGKCIVDEILASSAPMKLSN